MCFLTRRNKKDSMFCSERGVKRGLSNTEGSLPPFTVSPCHKTDIFMFSVRLRTFQYRDFNIITPVWQQMLHNSVRKLIVSQREKKKKNTQKKLLRLILSILLRGYTRERRNNVRTFESCFYFRFISSAAQTSKAG